MMKIIVLALLLSPIGLFAQASDSLLVWPSPPDKAHIRHMQTISSMADFKKEKGFFAKLVTLFTGEERNSQWLVQPVGIAVSPQGTIAVADPGANGIHIIDPKKKEYEFLRETKFGMFVSPVGVVYGKDGKLYVSDSERGEIIVLDEDLDAELSIHGPIVRPTGIDIIGGKLYIVDTGQHKILVFGLDGQFQFDFGGRGSGTGEFNFPVHLAGKDSVLVVDALNYRVQKFDLTGHFGNTFGEHGGIAGRFASPKSIALDSQGDIYVTDALMDNFQIFNSGGQLLLIVGTKGARNGEFMSPGGIAIDQHDKIYVVDTLNKRIQIFQYLQ